MPDGKKPQPQIRPWSGNTSQVYGNANYSFGDKANQWVWQMLNRGQMGTVKPVSSQSTGMPSYLDPESYEWESKEDSEIFASYMRRLERQLAVWVRHGRIKDDEMQAILNGSLVELAKFARSNNGKIPKTDAALAKLGLTASFGEFAKSLPYYSDVMAGGKKDGRITYDWEWDEQLGKEQSEYKVSEQKQQSAIVRYYNESEPYYNDLRQRGVLKEDDIRKIQADNVRLLQMGVSPKDLLDADSIKDYEGQKELRRRGEEAKKQTINRAIAGTGKPNPLVQEYQQREWARQSELADLDPDRGWIRKWQLEHQPKPPPLEPHLSKERVLGEAERLSALAQAYPDVPEYQEAAQLAQESLAQWEASGDWNRIPEPVKAPQPLPDVPDWLANITGQSKGTMLERNQVIPSGQQWSSLLPSQRKQMYGYLEWSGQKPEDVVAQMQMAQPESPRLGKRYWRPVGAR